jgi:Bacterial Ig-like domain (group 2)
MKGRRLGSAVFAALAASIASVVGCEHTVVAPRAVVKSVVITNPPASLVLGQTYCFTADVQVSHASDRSVTWRARHGTEDGILSQDGCYVADSVGSDTVTAVSRADTADQASTGFTISAPAPWPPDVLEDLRLSTYDGSGQAVHPSELYVPDGFAGWRYWTAVTPYPFTDAHYENPSLFVSSDGRNWTTPPGISNPLVLPGTARQSDATGTARYYTGVDDGTLTTLSDPDLVYDSLALGLRLYFRQVGQAGEQVFLMETADGSSWTTPQAVMSAYPAAGGDLISPSFVRESDRWQVWFVNGTCGAVSSSVQTASSPDGRSGWTAPQTVSISQPGYVIWHIQVRRIENAYWALYSAYPAFSTECFFGDLFLARSEDGVDWTTFSQPIVARSGAAMFSSGVYRSSMVYDPASDMLVLQISGFTPLGNRLASATGTMKVDFGRLTGALTPIPAALARASEHGLPQAAINLPFGDGETRRLLMER